jgi:hypothetical protein
VLALSYTYKTFYRSCSFKLKHILRSSQLASNRDMVHSERLELLYRLARDRKNPGEILVCSACVTTHEPALFPCEARCAPSSQRKCWGSEGRMWICPHKILDVNQIKAIKDHFQRPRGVSSNGLELPAILERCRDSDHYVSITSNQVRQWRPIIYINDEIPLCEENVVAALSSLNVSICPHLRVTDRIVHSLFSLDCARILQEISTCLWKLKGMSSRQIRCATCDTATASSSGRLLGQGVSKLCVCAS